MEDSSARDAPPQQRPPQGPRFRAVKTLGQQCPQTGFLQLAHDSAQGGAQVAIRYIPRSHLSTSSTAKHLLREVLNHHQLSLSQYPHIVQFHEVFLTPRYLGIVMEYVDGHDLQAYLLKEGGSLPVDVGRFLFQQLVLTVDFMHKRGKVHRDIRLSNILVVDSGLMPLLKLRNFHLSKDKVDDSAPRGQVGAALFTAPEVVLNVGGHAYEGELVDVWSCGVILYMMLFGHHPFLSHADMALREADQMVRLIENEVRGQLDFPRGADTGACDLLRRVLVPAPKQRYSMQEVMGHPWFQKKLPAGALELNSSYLQVTTYPNVRQATSTIKQLVQAAAAQPNTPAAAPVAASAPASVSSAAAPSAAAFASSSASASVDSSAAAASAAAFRDAVSLMQQQALAAALATGQLTVAHAVSLPAVLAIPNRAPGGFGEVGGSSEPQPTVLHIYPLSIDSFPR